MTSMADFIKAEADMANATAAADLVFRAHGREAPQPLSGETVAQYQRRTAVMMQQHSRWKDTPLSAIADGGALAAVTSQIYEDATREGRSPTNVPAGQLVERVRINGETGQRIREFFGQPSAWMGMFAGERRRLLKINNRPDEVPRQGL